MDFFQSKIAKKSEKNSKQNKKIIEKIQRKKSEKRIKKERKKSEKKFRGKIQRKKLEKIFCNLQILQQHKNGKNCEKKCTKIKTIKLRLALYFRHFLNF